MPEREKVRNERKIEIGRERKKAAEKERGEKGLLQRERW